MFKFILSLQVRTVSFRTQAASKSLMAEDPFLELF